MAATTTTEALIEEDLRRAATARIVVPADVRPLLAALSAHQKALLAQRRAAEARDPATERLLSRISTQIVALMDAASRLVIKNPAAARPLPPLPARPAAAPTNAAAEEKKEEEAAGTSGQHKHHHKHHKHHHKHHHHKHKQQAPANEAAPAPAPAPMATPALADGPPDIPLSSINYNWERDLIGAGSFGYVFHGTVAGNPVAVKVCKREAWTPEQREALHNEIAIMRKIFHPHVALFLGVSTGADGQAIIISELLRSDLERIIYDPYRGAITVERKLRMLRDAACGLNWLHSICGIIHRDLKLANLLIDGNDRVKVADFGLSELLRGGQIRDEKEAKGTPLYSAPEVLQKKPFDFSSDVYSFGLIMYEVMFEKRIFANHTQLQVFTECVAVRGERPLIPPTIIQANTKRQKALPEQPPPAGFVDLIRRCWDGNPRNRPAFPEILDELDAMLLEETMTNIEAREFWFNHFGKPALRTEVPWEEFVFVLVTELGVTANVLQQLFPIICAQEFDLSKTVNFVSMRAFHLVSCWFGPFFKKDIGPKILAYITTLIQFPWLHWDLPNKDAADARLLRRPSGTFLIRMSFTDPAQKPFTLSYVPYQIPTPKHVRIATTDRGTFALADPVTKKPIEVQSLTELVRLATRQHGTPLFSFRLTGSCPRECPSQGYTTDY